MEKILKLLIAGAAGWGNVGDDLIADALVAWAHSDLASAVVAGGPMRFGEAADSVGVLFSSRLKLVWAIFRADYVLIGGGGILDDRSENFYRGFTRVAKACRILRKPYSFVGIGVGPIRRPASARAYKIAAEKAHKIMVRDENSRVRLIECGVRNKISVVNDPVTWEKLNAETTIDYTVVPDYDVCLNLRNWNFAAEDPFTSISSAQFQKTIAETINTLLGDGYRVALLSFSNLEGDDDGKALDSLRKLLSAEVDSFTQASVAEVRETISRSRLVVSMRLHGCLLSLSMGVRTLGLAYDPKVAQQGERMGFPFCNLDSDFHRDSLLEAIRVPLGSRFVMDPAPSPIWR